MRYAKVGTHMPKFCFSRPQSRHSISGRQLPSNASSFPSLPPPSGGAQAGRGGRLPSAGPEAERCCGPATRQRRKSGGLLVRSWFVPALCSTQECVFSFIWREWLRQFKDETVVTPRLPFAAGFPLAGRRLPPHRQRVSLPARPP